MLSMAGDILFLAAFNVSSQVSIQMSQKVFKRKFELMSLYVVVYIWIVVTLTLQLNCVIGQKNNVKAACYDL